MSEIDKLLKEILTTDTCFNADNVFEFEGKLYEDMPKEDRPPSGHRYRVIFRSDDYDYVEDKNLIRKLSKR